MLTISCYILATKIWNFNDLKFELDFFKNASYVTYYWRLASTDHIDFKKNLDFFKQFRNGILDFGSLLDVPLSGVLEPSLIMPSLKFAWNDDSLLGATFGIGGSFTPFGSSYYLPPPPFPPFLTKVSAERCSSIWSARIFYM